MKAPAHVMIFSGPTLAHERGRALLPEASFLPPAAQGDVYRAVTVRRGRQPTGETLVLGLVDGFFDQVNSVAHKEILWAMANGVHVYGAASMGALRAVELAAFGMRGVGEVYQSFARGELQDDDEVAVSHGAADTGYQLMSTAMVDIRATLQAATERAIISTDTHAVLIAAAKNAFYADRCYPWLIQTGLDLGLDRDQMHGLGRFLATGRVECKRADALALLEQLDAVTRAPLAPMHVRYLFAHTDAWHALCRRVTAELAADA